MKIKDMGLYDIARELVRINDEITMKQSRINILRQREREIYEKKIADLKHDLFWSAPVTGGSDQ